MARETETERVGTVILQVHQVESRKMYKNINTFNSLPNEFKLLYIL